MDAAAKPQYVLVLSHMRSYSTLLCHILNNHPEVDGYAELHIPYRSAEDLDVLRQDMAATLDHPPAGRVVLDKILHDEYATDAAVLDRDDVRLVFTIREPERAVPSIIMLGRRTVPPDWKANPADATRYYCDRLQRLAATATAHPDRALYFDSELLVSDTQRVLDALRAHLQLDAPLRPTYEQHRFTGQEGYGDWSPFIAAGEIVTARESYDGVAVPDPLLQEARAAYERCRRILVGRCATVLADS